MPMGVPGIPGGSRCHFSCSGPHSFKLILSSVFDFATGITIGHKPIPFAFSHEGETQTSGQKVHIDQVLQQIVAGTIAGLRFMTALSFPVHHLEERPTG
jgi:hypothetical protein